MTSISFPRPSRAAVKRLTPAFVAGISLLGGVAAASRLPEDFRIAISAAALLTSLGGVALGLQVLRLNKRGGRYQHDIAELQHRLVRSSAEVARLNAEAKRAEAAREHALSGAGQDLRIPLDGMTSSIDVLKATRLSAAQKTVVGAMSTLIGVLNDMIADLETGAAGREPPPVRIEAVELNAAITQITDLLAPALRATGKTLKVRLMPPPQSWVETDRLRLQQALLLMLASAVADRRAGEIQIWAELAPGSEPTLFAPDDDQTLCLKVLGGDRRTLLPGLERVRALAAALNGELKIASNADGPRHCELRLPVKVAAQPGAQPRTASPQSAQMRVLAADDHPTNRRVVELMLSAVGASLTLVENGKAALDAWRIADFDVVLMDMQMPVMDGLEAIRQIREAERQAGRHRTPIAVLSAAAMAEDVAAALNAGADLHLPKPVTPSVLIAALNQTIENASRIACPPDAVLRRG